MPFTKKNAAQLRTVVVMEANTLLDEDNGLDRLMTLCTDLCVNKKPTINWPDDLLATEKLHNSTSAVQGDDFDMHPCQKGDRALFIRITLYERLKEALSENLHKEISEKLDQIKIGLERDLESLQKQFIIRDRDRGLEDKRIINTTNHLRIFAVFCILAIIAAGPLFSSPSKNTQERQAQLDRLLGVGCVVSTGLLYFVARLMKEAFFEQKWHNKTFDSVSHDAYEAIKEKDQGAKPSINF